jgi:hypothetical protein
MAGASIRAAISSDILEHQCVARRTPELVSRIRELCFAAFIIIVQIYEYGPAPLVRDPRQAVQVRLELLTGLIPQDVEGFSPCNLSP